MCMRRVGFTTIELIIVVVMIGIIAVIGFPKIRRALDTTNVRSTRVYLGTAVATARAAAVQRGCRAAVHFSSPGTVWVTACSRVTPAGTDTIGGVVDLASACTVRNPGSAVVWRGGTPVDSLSWRYTADTTNHWRLVLSSKYRTRQSQWRRDSMETYISCLL